MLTKHRGVNGRASGHEAQLHAFFSELVDDLSNAVKSIASAEFNNWLVSG